MRIALTLIIFACLDCHGQTALINRTIQRKDSNLLFYGLPNILEVPGGRNTKWQLKARHMEVASTDSPWLFKVEPHRWGLDTFVLARNGKVALASIFEVIETPDPTAHWGVLKKDTATRAEIIANRTMTVSIPGCNDNLVFQVVGFDIKYITDQFPEADKNIRIEGRMLTEAAAGLIGRLIPGDKIVFSRIFVVGRGTRVREIPGFTIVIR